jgi:hypothetical protein
MFCIYEKFNERIIWINDKIIIIDMIFKANSEYYEKGQIVNNHIKIIQHYFKSNFIFDLISFLGFV